MRCLLLLVALSATTAAQPGPLELRAGLTISHTQQERDYWTPVPAWRGTGPGVELDVGRFVTQRLAIVSHVGWSSFKTEFHDLDNTPHETLTRFQHVRLHAMIEGHLGRVTLGAGIGVDALHHSWVVSDGAVSGSETTWWSGTNLQVTIDVLRFDGGALGLVADVAQFPIYDADSGTENALGWRATTLSLGIVFRQL